MAVDEDGSTAGGMGKEHARSAMTQFTQAGRPLSQRICRRLHSSQPSRDLRCDLRVRMADGSALLALSNELALTLECWDSGLPVGEPVVGLDWECIG